LFPVWTAVVLLIDALAITEAALGGPGQAIAAVYVALLQVGLVELFVSRDTVRVGQNRHKLITLGNVHHAIVAALTEDRARDRVNTPARRAGFGDIRDDFDDHAG
jgi:hypothetical protein